MLYLVLSLKGTPWKTQMQTTFKILTWNINNNKKEKCLKKIKERMKMTELNEWRIGLCFLFFFSCLCVCVYVFICMSNHMIMFVSIPIWVGCSFIECAVLTNTDSPLILNFSEAMFDQPIVAACIEYLYKVSF